jgi:hypothetical protein
MDANMDMGLDQDIQLGRMLTNAFQRCDELRRNNSGKDMIIHEKWINGGELEDGKNNAIDVEFEAMNMEH